jgi:lipopolysaccharide/colanic/teichoic acid biosynthesis glycosyltransferase
MAMTLSKRIYDLGAAFILGAFIVLPFVALLVYLLVKQGRPIFYVAERMRAPERSFNLWKLRTMTVAPENSGVSGGDKVDRVTPMGRMLRKTRADEIPQLWNVLRGDMSFVGPRPPLRSYVKKFPELYAEVLKSRPGITGLATITYHRHEERLLARCITAAETDRVYSERCVPAKAKIDLIYQDHRSICFDIAIMTRTFLRATRLSR